MSQTTNQQQFTHFAQQQRRESAAQTATTENGSGLLHASCKNAAEFHPTAGILKIQRFSINDGPGIRTTVFFKGCPLRCRWCHNPDSLSSAPQLSLAHKLCTACGICAAACSEQVHTVSGGRHTVRYDACTHCGLCVEACPSSALSIQGVHMNVEEVMRQVLRDRDYYGESGGGMTLSGGEPTLQYEFTEALLREAAREGVDTALDTSGYCPAERFERLLGLTNRVLFDLKVMDPALHKACTGVDNALIHVNFRKAVESGRQVIVRHVVVPTLNDTDDEHEQLAGLLRDSGFKGRLELLPYHRMAIAKYDDLGLEYPLRDIPVPTHEEMDRIRGRFAAHGIDCRIN